MKRLILFLLIFTLILASCTQDKPIPKLDEISNENKDVVIKKINDNVWVHTSYTLYNGYNTPSNGLIVITSKGLVLIDTPWNNNQTKSLLKLLKENFDREVALTIVTHAHDDRMGGIDTLIENNIEVVSTELIAKTAGGLGYTKPEATLDEEHVIEIGDTKIETYYPGKGHSIDNIVTWIPKYKILFGGCLIKSKESTTIGNTADANIKEWPISVKKVLEKYKDAEIVIPGHGNWGDTSLIKHTLELLKNN